MVAYYLRMYSLYSKYTSGGLRNITKKVSGPEWSILPFLRTSMDMEVYKMVFTYVEEYAYSRFGVNRLAQLKTALLAQSDIYGADFKGIIFVERKIAVHIVEDFIQKDPELESRFGGMVGMIHSANSKASPLVNISDDRMTKAISKFRTGKYTILISTAVAEEGLDIPDANVVIRLDPPMGVVSYVQSRGRARQIDSSFIACMDKETIENFVQAEEDSRLLVNSLKGKKHSVEELETALLASVLNRKIVGRDNLQIINQIGQITEFQDSLRVSFLSIRHDHHKCTMTWTSSFRCVEVFGFGKNKRIAKQRCADELIIKLSAT
jgi:superfamily II DNA/RNA helicase